jgi:phosphoserine phosphatase RsbU/P
MSAAATERSSTTSESRTSVELHHNDVLRFGSTEARFHAPAAEPSPPSLAPPPQEPGQPLSGRVDIDESDEPTITDKLATSGRFGILEVNPEAKLKAVLEISNHLAGTVDLAALLPKILDSLFGIFRCADRGCIC